MATGIPFPEANDILRAPEGAAPGAVYDLHIHRYRDMAGNPHIISKWQFRPEELALVVAAGGAFWFHAWGLTHPPVAIEGENPFVRAGQGDAPAAEPEGHPNAQDYRNRAERAEAECAELRALLAVIDRDARPENWDDEPGSHADAWRALDVVLGR